MANTPNGGYYTEVFVYPLQKAKPENTDESGQTVVPNDGELTFHDGIGGNAISGNLAAWNTLSLHLLDHMDKFMYNSLQKIPDNAIHYERNHLVVNVFGKHDREICDKASSKFVIRLHDIDLRVMKVKPMKVQLRNMMIRKWINFYDFVCWAKMFDPHHLGVPFSG